MATGGIGNRAYITFLAHALKEHNDIDEVFIQSTYWGRFPIAINPDLDEKSIFPLDFFIKPESKIDKKIQRYSLSLAQHGKYLESYFHPEPADYDKFRYVKDTVPFGGFPDVRDISHMYMQIWHYNQTHLEQQEYMKNMTFIDMLCREKNIPVYLWNINDRCFIPKELDGFYTELKQTRIADIDAINFLKVYSDKQLDNETVDLEHYNYYVHNLIAKHYIPYIKEKTHNG